MSSTRPDKIPVIVFNNIIIELSPIISIFFTPQSEVETFSKSMEAAKYIPYFKKFEWSFNIILISTH